MITFKFHRHAFKLVHGLHFDVKAKLSWEHFKKKLVKSTYHHSNCVILETRFSNYYWKNLSIKYVIVKSKKSFDSWDVCRRFNCHTMEEIPALISMKLQKYPYINIAHSTILFFLSRTSGASIVCWWGLDSQPCI